MLITPACGQCKLFTVLYIYKFNGMNSDVGMQYLNNKLIIILWLHHIKILIELQM